MLEKQLESLEIFNAGFMSYQAFMLLWSPLIQMSQIYPNIHHTDVNLPLHLKETRQALTNCIAIQTSKLLRRVCRLGNY